MFDANQILGALMQSGARGGVGQRRLDNAVGQSGGLGGLLDAFTGGGAGGGAGGSLGDLAGGYLGQARSMISQNPQLAGGGIGALAGALLGRGQPMGSAVGGIAMGLLGMFAAKALQSSGDPAAATPAAAQAAQPTAAAGQGAQPAGDVDVAVVALQAMIAAAKADGQIDQAELDHILGKLEEAGASDEARRWVLEEMRKPLDLDEILAQVPDPHTGAQVYAASLLAIKVDTPAEQAYLQRLASGLGLSPVAVASLHQQLGVTTGPSVAAGPGPSGIKNPWRSS